MKAKEYAALILEGYAAGDLRRALVKTMNGLYRELGELTKARSIKLGRLVFPNYNDIDRKWRKICTIVNAKESEINLNPSGLVSYTNEMLLESGVLQI